MRDPYSIIIRPHVTEKSVAMSAGDPKVRDLGELIRTYTYIVKQDANKIEIKQALEYIYNKDKKDKEDHIQIDSIRTITMRGKMRRVGQRAKGKKPDFKKAYVTLAKGQMLEDYGV